MTPNWLLGCLPVSLFCLLLQLVVSQRAEEGEYTREYGVYIGRLRAYSNGVAGQVYIVDNRHLFIRNFRYQRGKPDTHFWVGVGKQPSPKGLIVPYPPLLSDMPMGPPEGVQISRFEQRQRGRPGNNRPANVPSYNTMQMRRKFDNINSRPNKNNQYYRRNNLGGQNNPRQNMPGQNIPGQNNGNSQMHPPPVGVFTYQGQQHSVRRGNQMNNRNNPNMNPNMNSNEYSSPFGSPEDNVDDKLNLPPIPEMKNENILLTMPDDLKVTHLNWLSIWCQRFTVSYAVVYLPQANDGVEIPTKRVLAPFPETLNKLSSGPVTILDTESFYIPNLHLMILEPGYHFWVGKSEYRDGPDNRGLMVANEKALFDDLGAYNGQDIIISLPKGTSVFDINYIAIFNVDNGDNVGHIEFNVSDWRVPPALGQTKKPGWWFDAPIQKPSGTTVVTDRPAVDNDPLAFIPFDHEKQLPNCKELLGRKIRLMWLNDGSAIYFRVKVHMDPKQYAAVGIVARGSPKIEADVVKLFYNSTLHRYITQDQFIAKNLNCDFANGICRDVGYGQARDDIEYMGSVKNHGLSIVDFKKSIIPVDLYDAPISMDGPTQVLVAIGSLAPPPGSYGNLNMEMENTTIDFSSDEVEYTCPDVNNNPKFVDPDEEESWDKSVIREVNLLVAHLGPPGGAKGYQAITGLPYQDHSVVWWINNKLLPEIYVERGKTYFFRVQGGDNPNEPNSFHPLYITDNVEGGYGQKYMQEKKIETVFAGVDNFSGQESPTGVGPLCELTSEGADKAAESDSLDDYYNTLNLACAPGRAGQYGWVNWTVAHDTPPLVYYQSYKDFGLGWKIHVRNEGQPYTDGQNGMKPDALAALLLAVTLISLL